MLPRLSLPFREPHRPDAGEAAAAAWPGGGVGATAGHRHQRVRTRRSELAGAGGREARTSRFRDDVRGGGDLSMPLSPGRIQQRTR